MRRRSLLGALAAPAFARDAGAEAPWTARSTAKRPRLGIATYDATTYGAVLEGLAELGWRPGQTIDVFHSDIGSPTEAIDRLLEQDIDLLIAPGASRVRHALARSRIPIVSIDLESDPIESGFAASLARPGGQVTGLWLDIPQLAGKIVQLFQEIVPTAKRAAILWDGRIGEPQFLATRQAADAAGLAVNEIRLGDDRDLADLVGGLRETDSMIVLGSPNVYFLRARIAEKLLARQVKSISILTDFARAGGLAAYGPNLLQLFKQSARYVDRLLKGAAPGEIPIERPTSFDFVVNLATAKALNVSVSLSLLARADEVIE